MPLVIAANRQAKIAVVDANTGLAFEGALDRLDGARDIAFEGSILTRPAMEGRDRPGVVVDRFVRTRTDTTCARQRANASLRNTYWKLEQIDGADVPVVENRIEPHLVLEAGDGQGYRATVGCNRMRGGFELEGETLTFGAAASTMMACPALASVTLSDRIGR